MKYIIANWKANKNIEEAEKWVNEFSALLKNNKELLKKIQAKSLKIIIAPSFHLLSKVKELLPENIFLAAQDLSFYNRGSYTGEVPASTLVGLVEYAILGHSERRKYFKETNNVVDQKVVLALENDIEPILCVRGPQDLIPKGAQIIAYEPEASIGTGENAKLVDVLEMKKKLSLNRDSAFLYGGSVDENSIKDYLKSDGIGGFLIGGASNNPVSFYKMATLI